MAFLGLGKKKEELGIDKTEYEYSPLIVIDEAEVALASANKVNPKFKGEVEKQEVKFPREIGEEHPFDFSTCEGLYKKFGFVTGVIDKFVDFVVGPGFYVISKDEKAQKICEDFMQDVNFDTVLRAWVKEALIKGNGFLELGGKKDEAPKGMKVLNANYMYVKRDDLGKIEKYNQYIGGFKRLDKNKITPFDPYQIAHIPFNRVGDSGYGLGVISSALVTINNLLQNEQDLHMLMHRKANAPYIVKLGGVFGGKYYKPKKSDVEAMGKKLEWLHNKHEWAVDGLTDIKALDFGNIGEKFDTVLQYDQDMLFYTFQVPAVIMGAARVPEGLARVQMDAFERRVQSIQAEVEKVIEQHIFRRLLQANGIDSHVEFEWGRPSSMETYERLKAVTEIIKSPMTSSALNQLLEKQVVQLLNLPEEEYDELKQTGEEERKKEEERPQPIVPGQNSTPTKFTPKEEEKLSESLNKFNDISEWLGFKYNDYKKEILSFISEDSFDMVKAQNVIEEAAGKLSQSQVTDLKSVLEDGFKKEIGIREMAMNVDKKVKPKDLYRMKAGKIVRSDGIPVLARSAEMRSIAIVRSEVTRVANAGAINQFKKGGVTKIRWVASYGARTCPTCDSLNGRIFDINEHPDIPVHPMCRCTVVPVREII